MNAAEIPGILDAIYESAVSHDAWPQALQRLGSLFGCSCVSLVDKNRDNSQSSAAAWGVDAQSQREYLDVWLERNVLHWHTRVWRQSEVETDRDVLTRPELLRSDYYNGFMKPRDMLGMLRVATLVDDKSVQILALARPRSAAEYDRADVEQLRALVRHVQRAVTISRQLSESREALSGVSTALEQSATGIVLLSRNGSVTFVNRAARAMIERVAGLRLREGRLSARLRSEDDALQRLIAGATGRLDGIENCRGGAIHIAADSGGPPTTLVVGPLQPRAMTDDRSPAAFVLLSNPDSGTSRPAWMLRSLYDLSAAEASIAERLMKGETPEEAAAALNIKISTARWHLSSLFRKTDTRRQAELVRLLLSLPMI
jgi:DNA-binding CsgD family transcriptional regulator/PAS domain-containing protein